MASDKPLVSRKEALEKGLPTYFTGKPCKHGHVSERYASNCGCCECEALRHTENREADCERHKKYYEENREATLERQRKYYKNNLEKDREKNARRRAAKLQRTPEWADREAIKEIYYNCPQGMHVDHIIPLQGETVSGLHVPENLQYLTPQENAAKGNNYASE